MPLLPCSPVAIQGSHLTASDLGRLNLPGLADRPCGVPSPQTAKPPVNVSAHRNCRSCLPCRWQDTLSLCLPRRTAAQRRDWNSRTTSWGVQSPAASSQALRRASGRLPPLAPSSATPARCICLTTLLSKQDFPFCSVQQGVAPNGINMQAASSLFAWPFAWPFEADRPTNPNCAVCSTWKDNNLHMRPANLSCCQRTAHPEVLVRDVTVMVQGQGETVQRLAQRCHLRD